MPENAKVAVKMIKKSRFHRQNEKKLLFNGP